MKSKLIYILTFFLLVSILLSSIPALAGDNGGSALDFDGTNDWIDATNNGGAVNSATNLGLPTRDITLEVWANPRSYSTWRSMVSFFQDNGSFERGWDLETGSGNRFTFALAGTSGGALTYMSTTNTFQPNTWYHIAGTYDGTTMRIYVNGMLENTSTTESGDISYANSWLAIGMYKDDNEAFSFPGQIDEVRIWNVARSQAQIQADMFTELTGSEPNLVSYWNLNEGSGIAAADSAGSNHGILNNMDPATDWVGSTAPLGDSFANAQTDISGFWAANNPANSAGLIFTDNSFLNDVGDDIIFGHNDVNGKTSADLPTDGAWTGAPDPTRWNRTWYCDLNDQGANGGAVDLVFDFAAAGMGADPAPAGSASNYRLLERAGTSGSFTDLGGATAVDTGNRTVTFSGVNVSSLCSYITLGSLNDSNSPTAIELQTLKAESYSGPIFVVALSGLVLVVSGLIVWKRRKAG